MNVVTGETSPLLRMYGCPNEAVLQKCAAVTAAEPG